MENVIVLGASNKADRYSYQAIQLLKQYKHNAIAVNPQLTEIEGQKVFASIADACKSFPKIDSISVYVNPQLSTGLEDAIIKSGTKRVIFNPGSENPDLMKNLEKRNIAVEAACTLVLLRTGQF